MRSIVNMKAISFMAPVYTVEHGDFHPLQKERVFIIPNNAGTKPHKINLIDWQNEEKLVQHKSNCYKNLSTSLLKRGDSPEVA